MTNIILCDVTASVSELKNDPVATASAGGGYPVAIIDRNRPVFYCVPAALYEQMLDACGFLILRCLGNGFSD